MTTSYDEFDKLWERLRGYGSISRHYAYSRWNLQQIDLRGQDFSGVHFPKQCNFEHALLQEANLKGALLEEANLRSANLSRANLRSAELQRADLTYSDLSYSDLEGASLLKSRLTLANLTGAVLVKSDLRYCDFSHSILHNCDCSFADIYMANFTSADLSNANFDGADITGIKLNGAITNGMSLEACYPKKRYILPMCPKCGEQRDISKHEYKMMMSTIEDVTDKNGSVERCLKENCRAHLDFDGARILIVGTDGTEVAKVIAEVRKMQSQDRVTINISGGQVGNLNLGEIIGNLEANLTNIRKKGDEELAFALKNLTELVLTSNNLRDQEKNEITEQIEELVNQAGKPEKERKVGVVRSVITTLGSILSTIHDIEPVWAKTVELLCTFFAITA